MADPAVHRLDAATMAMLRAAAEMASYREHAVLSVEELSEFAVSRRDPAQIGRGSDGGGTPA